MSGVTFPDRYISKSERNRILKEHLERFRIYRKLMKVMCNANRN